MDKTELKTQGCQGSDSIIRQCPLAEVLLSVLRGCSNTAWLGDLDQPAVKSCEMPCLGPLDFCLESVPNLRPLPKM